MRKIGPEDIVAFGLLFVVLFQMALIGLAKYNGIEVDPGVTKEILIFILGGLITYISKGSKKDE
jgi:hypothetical protein